MLQTLLKFVGGAALGMATGAVVGLLLAPESGHELQDEIRAYINEVKAAGRQAEEDRRQALQSSFAQAKQFRPGPAPVAPTGNHPKASSS